MFFFVSRCLALFSKPVFGVLMLLIFTHSNASAENVLQELSGEEDTYAYVSSIPEPMVFDLVRSLGARQGELEINSLAQIPLRQRGRSRSVREITDSLEDTHESRIDWAPEIEYAVFDDFALEFELPFEDEKLVAYKFAYQWTLGTSSNGKMVHGTQGIAEYNRFTEVTELTFLYINGFVLSQKWSLLSMVGLRGEAGGKVERGPLEILINANLFYSLGEHIHAGFEIDSATAIDDGENSILLMPQFGIGLSRNWFVQSGVGIQLSDERALPLLALRLIWAR